jgi:hypothetical protein
MGAFTVRDPRVSEQDNDNFLDLLERYFEQPDGILSNVPGFHTQEEYDYYITYIKAILL